MEIKDIEKLLEEAKYNHLGEATLISYRDSQLDSTGLALADAHLKLCVICERRLIFLKEDAEALETYVMTEEDRAAIRQSVKEQQPQTRNMSKPSAQRERLASSIRDLLTAWTIPFSQPAMRGTNDGDEIWRYESEDGLLTAWAVLDQQANLIVHFSSPELSWEGFQLRFRLGPFHKEVTLQHEGKNKVTAKVIVPRRERAKKMKDISIEVIPAS